MTEPFSKQFVRSVDANRTVKDALVKSVGSSRRRSRISVTDLLSPMQAFHKWTYPDIKPSPDRLQIMISGTGFHEEFGKLVSTEEYLEQLLELDGIIGKVDIFEDVPVELKTSSSIPTNIYKGRSSYFEQLGMYCAMANKETGRLFIYKRQRDEQPTELKVYEAKFTNLEGIIREMKYRRDIFHDALERNDPSKLPQCEWLYRGCDYATMCPCRDLTPISPVVSRDEVDITEMPDLAEELKTKLSAVPPKESGLRLNDLVFPRKTACQRNLDFENDQIRERTRPIQELERKGFRYALYTALRYGSPDHFKGVSVKLDSMVDKVDMYNDIPTILRTSRVRDMIQRDNLPSFFSYYFDRLAFECALTNIRQGRLILYYEQIPGDKFMVYDISFHNREAIMSEVKRRINLLESNAPITDLPSCPSWMAGYCEFSPNCHCADELPSL